MNRVLGYITPVINPFKLCGKCVYYNPHICLSAITTILALSHSYARKRALDHYRENGGEMEWNWGALRQAATLLSPSRINLGHVLNPAIEGLNEALGSDQADRALGLIQTLQENKPERIPSKAGALFEQIDPVRRIDQTALRRAIRMQQEPKDKGKGKARDDRVSLAADLGPQIERLHREWESLTPEARLAEIGELRDEIPRQSASGVQYERAARRIARALHPNLTLTDYGRERLTEIVAELAPQVGRSAISSRTTRHELRELATCIGEENLERARELVGVLQPKIPNSSRGLQHLRGLLEGRRRVMDEGREMEAIQTELLVGLVAFVVGGMLLFQRLYPLPPAS